MLILLPPSAGKTPPAAGPTLDLAKLTAPELNPVRERVIDALQQASTRPDALKILKVGPSIEAEVRSQIDFYAQPCAPAAQLYTGVLFEAAGFAQLDDAELTRADARVLIYSAVFGYTRPSDLICSYRLSMNTTLPELGKVGTLWRRELGERGALVGGGPAPSSGASVGPSARGVLAGSSIAGDSAADNPGLVVDCRSGEYQVDAPAAPAEHVAVGAVRIKDGKRTTVSHSAKYYRGLLTGALIREVNPPRSATELAEFARTLIGVGAITGVELGELPRGRKQLTIVEDLDIA